MSEYTPEQLRDWAKVEEEMGEQEGPVRAKLRQHVADQLRAHAAALEELAALRAELASVNGHTEALKERIWQIRCELGALFTMLPGEVPGLAMEVCERDEDRKCLFRAFELAAYPKE